MDANTISKKHLKLEEYLKNEEPMAEISAKKTRSWNEFFHACETR